MTLKILDRFFRDTQYRVDYPGHDTNQHPRQQAAAPKDHQRPYMAPVQKMDTLTVTQVILSSIILKKDRLIVLERLSTH